MKTGDKIADVKVWFEGADKYYEFTLIYNNEPDTIEDIVEDLCSSLYDSITQFQAVYNTEFTDGKDMVFLWSK